MTAFTNYTGRQIMTAGRKAARQDAKKIGESNATTMQNAAFAAIRSMCSNDAVAQELATRCMLDVRLGY